AYGDAVQDRNAAEEKWHDPAQESNEEPKAPPFTDTKEYFYHTEAIAYELQHPRKVPEAAYQDNMTFNFHKWYETEESDPQYFAYNREQLEKLIDFCLQHNWRPVLITIPVTQVLEEGLLDDYKQVYLYDNLAQVDTQGVEYIDFTTNRQLTENMFLYSNADHF